MMNRIKKALIVTLTTLTVIGNTTSAPVQASTVSDVAKNAPITKVIDCNDLTEEMLTTRADHNIMYIERISNKVKLKNGYVYFAWKPFKKFNNLFRTYAKDRILQCRFIPKCRKYVIEIVYEIEVPDVSETSNRVAAIDIGVDNFITMVNNIGENPIAVKGGIIKSINQYYNKRKADIQSELKKANGKDWSKKLQKLTDKRYEMIKYQMHCISKYVVDWCVLYGIDTLIVGHNNNWKQENKGMQNCTYIPYELFIQMLAYKCENNGIKFIENEEAYTSGTSFLDNEDPVKENYKKERRVYRGLFVSNDGKKINADVNGAYQIMKKVIPDAFSKGIEGAGLHPTIINLTCVR